MKTKPNQDGAAKAPSVTTDSNKTVGTPRDTKNPGAESKDAQLQPIGVNDAQKSSGADQSQTQKPAIQKRANQEGSETKWEDAWKRSTAEVLAILTQNLHEGWKPVPDFDRHVDNALGDALAAARNARELLGRHLLGRRTTVLGYYIDDEAIGSDGAILTRDGEGGLDIGP